MASPLFQLEQFVVGHVGVALNEPVDLSIDAGQIVALVGRSGSGKTTFLRTAVGLIDPIAGEVKRQGRTPGQVGWPRWRRRVVWVSQQPVLLDDTVESNLRRPFEYAVADRIAFDRDRAMQQLASLDLDSGVMDEPARQLSVGQQQRVCIVRALLLDPDVLLVDEPTSALDDTSADRVEAAIKQQATHHGTAVLVVTHRADRAQRWCDRVVTLTPAESQRTATASHTLTTEASS